MNIKIKKKSYEEVCALPRPQHKNPLRPSRILQWLIRFLSIPTRFKCRKHRMEKIGKKEPCLILMNHSCFMDLKIASKIFFPKRYNIISTTDAMVGLGWLMHWLGCIPTQKYVHDVTLIRDMEYALKKNKTSVLMFPEAGYSFDGTATTMPRKMGVLLKKLDVPVVTVITQGAFHRNPLYNGLQLRKVKVSADVTCLLTREEIASMSVAQLDAKLEEVFAFDNFRWQQENQVVIDEPFRADYLNRVLYQCPHCLTEGKMEGKGIALTCHHCGKVYTLTETGHLSAEDGKFDHVPDWYKWQRDQVRQELENGSYKLDVDVDIAMLVDYKALYMVGQGRLTHDIQGFHLTGCDGKLDYSQGPLTSFGLNADYLWYEIGDVICIGDRNALYYCFPKGADVVAKTRLATEELYKLKKSRKL